jgi:hypothetical protein
MERRGFLTRALGYITALVALPKALRATEPQGDLVHCSEWAQQAAKDWFALQDLWNVAFGCEYVLNEACKTGRIFENMPLIHKSSLDICTIKAENVFASSPDYGCWKVKLEKVVSPVFFNGFLGHIRVRITPYQVKFNGEVLIPTNPKGDGN